MRAIHRGGLEAIVKKVKSHIDNEPSLFIATFNKQSGLVVLLLSLDVDECEKGLHGFK